MPNNELTIEEKAARWDAAVQGMSMLKYIALDKIPEFLSEFIDDYNSWGQAVQDINLILESIEVP